MDDSENGQTRGWIGGKSDLETETCGVECRINEALWMMKALREHTVDKQRSAGVCRKQEDGYKSFHRRRSEFSNRGPEKFRARHKKKLDSFRPWRAIARVNQVARILCICPHQLPFTLLW